MNTLSRRQFIIFNLQLMVWASLSGCRSSSPILGTSPIPHPLVVENHSQLLAKWAEQGIRDAVLINIDSHDDFRWITDEKVSKLKEIYQRRDWKRFADADTTADRGLYHLGNWIYAGARLGMFKEICWVIPLDLFSRPNHDELLRKLLKHFRFKEEDIRTFTARDNRFRGSFQGIPVTICGIESLPDFKQPLLLSVDADFFPTYTDNYQVEYLTSLRTAFEALYKKNYHIHDAAVCYSVNGDYLLPIHRWVGDTATSILKKPDMINAPPPELLAILQQCDNSFRSGDAESILRLVEQPLLKQPQAALLLYKAYAHLLQGDFGNTLEAAIKCCHLDPLYCTGIPYLGTLYYMNGKYQQAEKLFRAGFSANPTMHNGYFYFANCLRKVGKLQEAVSWYEKCESQDGNLISRVIITEIHLTLGNHQAAQTDIKQIVGRLQRDIYAMVPSQMLANSLYAIIDYCENNGLKESAVPLRNNSEIKDLFSAYPTPVPDEV
jgi:tetratricopeptide (TPR) repeat protein